MQPFKSPVSLSFKSIEVLFGLVTQNLRLNCGNRKLYKTKGETKPHKVIFNIGGNRSILQLFYWKSNLRVISQ